MKYALYFIYMSAVRRNNFSSESLINICNMRRSISTWIDLVFRFSFIAATLTCVSILLESVTHTQVDFNILQACSRTWWVRLCRLFYCLQTETVWRPYVIAHDSAPLSCVPVKKFTTCLHSRRDMGGVCVPRVSGTQFTSCCVSCECGSGSGWFFDSCKEPVCVLCAVPV